jgi:hypothetical protein
MSAAARITLPSFFTPCYWGNPVLHYLISALILLAAFFLRKALARLMQVVIRLFAKKNRTAGSRLAEAVLPGLKLMVFCGRLFNRDGSAAFENGRNRSPLFWKKPVPPYSS